MTESPRKPGAGFCATIALMAALIGYPLSFGPVCWLASSLRPLAPAVNVIYRPMMWAWDAAPSTAGNFLDWYSRVGAANGVCWMSDNTWR